MNRLKTAAMRNRFLLRIVRTVLAIVAVIRRPPFFPPGHFYSPSTAPSDAERALGRLESGSAEEVPGVDLRADEQVEFARSLAPMLAEPFEGPRYSPANEMFTPADAALYRAMLRHLRPKRVIEIGSGYSTAIALECSVRGYGRSTRRFFR